MKIHLSQYAGFCDGVARAYKIVEKAAKNKKTKKPIFMLGSLVHNDDVVKRIEEMGVKKINFDKNIKNTFKKWRGKIGTVVVTAHGFGPDIYDFAKKEKIEIIDTTCPRVFKVQRLAKAFSARGSQVIILGEKNHKEVKGIFEWAGKNAQIIETEKDLRKLKLDRKRKIVLVSQTTQNEEFFKKISQKLEKENYKLKIFNTVCDTTHNRQNEVKKMAEKNELVVIIGSTRSSNSKRLWEISREINPLTFFVENAGKIKKAWFKNIRRVGVMAGASTPKWIIDKTVKRIQSF